MSDSKDPSLYSLMEKVLSDDKINNDDKIKLIDELRKNNPIASDRWAPRVAIWTLGITVVISVICISLLTYFSDKTSEGLISIGSAAVGGLAGLISQTQRKNEN